MEFNFANWDFTTWFNQYVPDDVASGSRRGDFARYAFDMVYSYEYQGVSLWNHGGVKMTCKNRLSMQPTYRESDFSPIETVIDDRGEKRNVTTEGGIRFMMKPPDLRFDPAVEPFDKDDGDKPGFAAKGVAKAFPHLDQNAVDDWQALYTIHKNAPHSGALPLLPTDVSFTGAGGTSKTRRFVGTPMELKPILKALQRFDRPLITWDIFNTAAPSQFPMEPMAEAQDQEATAPNTSDISEAPLRDPRVVNQVTHADYTRSEYNKTCASLSAEEWIDGVPNRLEDSHWDAEAQEEGGGLYIVLLEEPDGEYLLGLGRDCGPSDEVEHRMLQWFGRCSKGCVWPASVKFDQAHWNVKESYPFSAFLIQVDEENEVTESSTLSKPWLCSAFVKRLALFAGA